MTDSEAAYELRVRKLVEASAIIVITGIALLVSELAFGGETFVGGLLGWLGLMLGIFLTHVSLRRYGESWPTIGLSRPGSWIGTLLQAIGGAVVVIVILNLLIPILVLPVFGAPDSSRFAAIAGNKWLLAAGLFSVWTAAAFGEEIIFRGLFMSRLARALGSGVAGWSGAVLIQSAVFGAIHFYQGLSGVVISGLVGLLFGLLFVTFRRNLWSLVLAHGLIDTVSLVTLYLS